MKKLFAIVCLIALFNASLSKADEAECRKVLHDCDTALKEEQQLNLMQATLIQLQEDRFKIQAQELHNESLWKPIAIAGFTVAISVTAILLLKH